ncbi:MAG: hypothetical protein ACRC92_04230 [Peptostreptococcaceae bacterium]
MFNTRMALENIKDDIVKCLNECETNIKGVWKEWHMPIDLIIECGNSSPERLATIEHEDEARKMVGIFLKKHIGWHNADIKSKLKKPIGGERDRFTESLIYTFSRDVSVGYSTHISGRDHILELDVNLVDYLSEKKTNGIDISYHVMKYIGERVIDYFTKVDDYLKVIIMNMCTNEDLPFIEYLYHSTHKQSASSDLEIKLTTNIRDAKTYQSILVNAMLDCFIVWLMDAKLVKGKVIDDKKITTSLRTMIRNITDMGSIDGLAYFITMGKDLMETPNSDSFIRYVINKVMYLNSLNCVQSGKAPTLKYTPLFDVSSLVSDFRKRNEHVYNEDAAEPDTTECVAESIQSFKYKNTLDYSDPRSVVNFKALGKLTGYKPLTEALRMTTITGNDLDIITEAARRVDQVNIEFEFMSTKYEKKDAIGKAYNTIEWMNKKKVKLRNRDAILRMDDLIESCYQSISTARDKNTHGARTTIQVKYPNGFQG